MEAVRGLLVWVALVLAAVLSAVWGLLVAVAVRFARAPWRVPTDPRARYADLEVRTQAWIRLADLLFVDNEWDERHWESTGHWLRAHGFDARTVRAILVHEVAPVAGANFAYLLYPIIPSVWAGFDDSIAIEIAAHATSPSRRMSDALVLGPILREAFYGRLVEILEWRRLEAYLHD